MKVPAARAMTPVLVGPSTGQREISDVVARRVHGGVDVIRRRLRQLVARLSGTTTGQTVDRRCVSRLRSGCSTSINLVFAARRRISRRGNDIAVRKPRCRFRFRFRFVSVEAVEPEAGVAIARITPAPVPVGSEFLLRRRLGAGVVGVSVRRPQ